MSDEQRHGGRRCKEIFARLSEYLDHELPDDLCDRIEGHMKGCPPCQAFLESLQRTVRWVEEQDAPAMPDDVRESVRRAWRRCRDDSG